MNEDRLLVWRGPFASMMRIVDYGSARTIALAATLLYLIAGLAAMPFVFGITELEQASRPGMGVVSTIAIITAFAIAWIRTRGPETFEWVFPPIVVSASFGSTLLINASVYFVGPTFGNVAVYLVQIPLVSFILLKARWAVTVCVVELVGFAFALSALDGVPAPEQQIVNVIAAAVATGVLVGRYAQRMDDARTTLAGLNTRLRRFLAPQVVAVVADEVALTPHRRDIAVLFVDLRGFTAFTNAVVAERVMHVLNEYYDAVGTILDAHDATIGGFDGDGIFAYLGDPTPRDDAAEAAIALAIEIADRLDGMTDVWSGDDASLGYGIGLAYGEATLGVVGFASRADYTPVGSVVNLASRLCAEATHREVLIDEAMFKRAELDDGVARRGHLHLKGFGSVTSYRLVR